MLCSRKNLLAKKCKDMKRGVKSQFSVEKFLSNSTEKFRRGTLLCCVSKKFRWQKSLWKKSGQGDLSKLSVEIFLSHSTEIFSRGALLCCVSENFRLRRKLWIRRGR